MKKYRYYQIDSFTKEKFTGNPAGVITNAEGLTDSDMQRIAREVNNSETAFIFSSDTPGYDVAVRFFTPTKEVPICGHATIAAHYARAIEGSFPSVKQLHKTGAGILPIEIQKNNEDYRILMTQGKIEFGPCLINENKAALITALKIKEEDLLENHEIQVVSTGHSKVMVGTKSKELLNQLKPSYDQLAKLSEVIGCNGFYIFTYETEASGILINGRMFAPAIGINEDPVTGNANGPLGAYLVHHGLAPKNLFSKDGSCFSFKAKQGEAIGRTGIIEVEVFIKEQEPELVRISGNAVIAFQTEIEI